MIDCPPEDLPLPAQMMSPAAWAWIVLIAAVVAYEVWALRTGHQTLSQWLQHWSAKSVWVKVLGIGALIFAGWHWFR